MNDKAYLARQINALFRLVGQKLTLSDSEKMQIADLYPVWEADKSYAVGTIVKHGTNADSETQLYSVIQAHTSAEEWTPDTTPSLFKAIGFTDSGVPLWTQPLGASDAYNQGDRVSFEGDIYVSDINANVWQPTTYGWTKEGE
jgi:hypothetical protein